MVPTIARRELTELLRDRRLTVLAAVILVLALAALVFGSAEQARFAEGRAEAIAADRAIWRGQGEVNPHSAAHFGMFAFRPRASLTLFDPGLSPWMGEAVWVEAHYQNPAQGRPAEASALVQRFGDLSAAWMLQTLLPLFIVLAGFASVAGERERGALRLQLVQGASAWRLVMGKALALFALAMLVALPLLVIGGGVALTLTDNGGDATARWFGLLFAYAGYALIWTAFTLGVSALAGSARQALVILLASWVLAVALLPRFAADTAARAHPTMAAGAFWDAITAAREEGIDGHDPSDARTKALQEAVMKQYGVERMEDLPVDFSGIALQAGEDYGNRVFDRFYGELRQAQDAQQRMALAYSPLSPLMALKPLSAGLAGNDVAHQEAFTAAAEQHRRAVQRRLNEEQTAHGKGANFNNKVDADFWNDVPTFDWRLPPLGEVARTYVSPVLIMLAWLVVALLFLLIAGRRMETRA